MKKLVLFFAAVLLTAISANVFAQGTGGLPSVGTTHEYWVNSNDGSAHDGGGGVHVGNTYTWWVSTNPTDLTVVEPEGTLFSVASGPAYNTATVDSFKIGIMWDPSSVEDTLYVVVQETDADGNLCSNLKAMPVVPQNDFEVQFVALASDGTTPGDSLSRCAPDIALTASGLDITYDYGVDTVMFQLNASGIYTAWSSVNGFTVSSANMTATWDYQIVSVGGWTTIADGASIPVPLNATGSEQVIVRVAIDNGDSNGTPEENTTDQTIQLTLTGVEGAGNVPATVVDANNVEFPTDNAQFHTIQARPATSGIGTN